MVVVIRIEGENFFGHGESRFGGNTSRRRVVNPARAIAMSTDSRLSGKALLNSAGQVSHGLLLFGWLRKSLVKGELVVSPYLPTLPCRLQGEGLNQISIIIMIAAPPIDVHSKGLDAVHNFNWKNSSTCCVIQKISISTGAEL
jgi:hypothetical protein